MPTSIEEGKEWLTGFFENHRPDTVLDVGPGEGTYAKLWRPLHKGVWWTGVEVWKPYISKYKLKSTKTRVMYDEMHNMNAMDAPAHLFYRDLVILGDVLEHMPREQAIVLLNRIHEGPEDGHGALNVAVSVPIVHAPQGAVEGNPYEEHVHHYTVEEMTDMLHECLPGGTLHMEPQATVGVWWWSRWA